MNSKQTRSVVAIQVLGYLLAKYVNALAAHRRSAVGRVAFPKSPSQDRHRCLWFVIRVRNQPDRVKPESVGKDKGLPWSQSRKECRKHGTVESSKLLANVFRWRARLERRVKNKVVIGDVPSDSNRVTR